MSPSTFLNGQGKRAENPALLADVVLEGGGVRGIGHVGALCVAEEQGYRWRNIAGTSAGAFVAALLAAGYNGSELHGILRDEVDFRRFAQDTWFASLLPIEAFHLLIRGGIHAGNYIENFIREKLKAKGIAAFGDLITRANEAKASSMRYRLTVIASDISSGQMLRLPQDIGRFGLDPDALDIALAVRMSASIPFYFLPIQRRRSDGRDCMIVDGGLLSNFPVSLFDVPGLPEHPTFGLRLVDVLPTPDCPWPPNPTCNILQISRALLKTMLTAHDRLYLDNHTFVRTIAIPVDGISATQFDLSRAQAAQLYSNGRQAAQQFFTTWDFASYKATYRSGQPQPGRQQQLHTQMKQAALHP
jgi:NTE family protein